MALEEASITWQDAKTFIAQHHRHRPPPQGWKWGFAATQDGEVVGVVTVGRPTAPSLDDGETLEITRVATTGAKNAASFLLGRAVKQAYAKGAKRVITYTLPSESGASLRATGFRVRGRTEGKAWPSRDGSEKQAKYAPERCVAWIHDAQQPNLQASLHHVDPQDYAYDDHECSSEAEELVDDDGVLIGFQGYCGCIDPLPGFEEHPLVLDAIDYVHDMNTLQASVEGPPRIVERTHGAGVPRSPDVPCSLSKSCSKGSRSTSTKLPMA